MCAFVLLVSEKDRASPPAGDEGTTATEAPDMQPEYVIRGPGEAGRGPIPPTSLDLESHTQNRPPDRAWWALVFLNMASLWPYFSILSAQNYYLIKLPTSGLSFTITVFVSWPMVIAQALQVGLGLDKRMGITPRVVGGFTIYALVGILLIVQDLLPLSDNLHIAVILTLTFAVGMTNTLTESVLYGLAGLFPDASHLTQAVQLGNGLAGTVNVGALTLIRLLMLPHPNAASGELIAYYGFMAFLVLVSVAAILVFLQLRRMPFLDLAITSHRHAHHELVGGAHGSSAKASLPQTLRRLCPIAKEVWAPSVCLFLVHLTSLSLFPGIPCAAPPSGLFASPRHPEAMLWYCSPLIVGGYAMGDLGGRWVTGPKLLRRIDMPACLALSVVRSVLCPVLVLLGVRPWYVVQSLWYEAGLMVLLGASNGLLATLALCHGARQVTQDGNRETASYMMVWALYLGIAAGATGAYAVQSLVQ